MPDLNQIQINGTTYDIADTTAREKNEVQDNELTSLKSALDAIETFIDIRKSTGVYVKTSDGTLGLDSNYNVYTCNVVGLSEVKITPWYTTDKLTYAFYKKDGTYISNSSGTLVSSGENTVSVPTDAYTIKYSSIIYKDATIKADWGKLIAIKSTVEIIDDRVDELESNSVVDAPEETSYSDMDTSRTGYLNSSGNVVSYSNAYVSDYVAVKAGEPVSYKTVYIYGSSIIAACFYNSLKQFISGSGIVAESGTSGNWKTISGTVTAPINAAYIRFTMSKTTQDNTPKEDQFFSYVKNEKIKDYIETFVNPAISNENPWNGKNWVCFGTSITDVGAGTGKYVPVLKNLSGMIVTNRGIAGGTLGSGGIHGGSSNILNAILNSNDLDDFDLITIEGFVNDYACAISIGEIGDTENTTFCGALYQAISYCLEHSHAEVVLITETTGQQYEVSGTVVDYRILKKNSLDLLQQAYNDAIIRMGQYYGVHVIDAGGKSQINQYHPEYIIDQIHHTELGGEQYAKTIWEELKNITPAKVASN